MSFNTDQAPVVDTYETFEDTSFTSGESPVTLDANAALGRNATKFFVFNTGAGSFTVATNSTSGGTFGDEHTVASGEVFPPLNINMSVDSIRITHVSDSGYKVLVI